VVRDVASQTLNDALSFERLIEADFGDADRKRLSPMHDVEASKAVYQAQALSLAGFHGFLDLEFPEDKESMIHWAMKDVIVKSEILALRIACHPIRFEITYPGIGVVVDEQNPSECHPAWEQIPQICTNTSRGRIIFVSTPGLRKRWSVKDLGPVQHKIDFFSALVFVEETDEPISVERDGSVMRPTRTSQIRRPTGCDETSACSPPDGINGPISADPERLMPRRVNELRRQRPAPIRIDGPPADHEPFHCSVCDHYLISESSRSDFTELLTPLTATFPSSSSASENVPSLCEACTMKAAPGLMVINVAHNKRKIHPISPNGMGVSHSLSEGIKIYPMPDSDEVKIDFPVPAAYGGVQVNRLEDNAGIEVYSVSPEQELWEVPGGRFWKSKCAKRYKLITESGSFRIGLGGVRPNAENRARQFQPTVEDASDDDGDYFRDGHCTFQGSPPYAPHDSRTYARNDEEQARWEQEQQDRNAKEVQERKDQEA
jgi:hypothetical protein